MLALSICNPYPYLICNLPDGDPDQKRVENRTWPAPRQHDGKHFLIHAGKSKDWMGPGDMDAYPDMAFGAIVGSARLIGCYSISTIEIFAKHGKGLPTSLRWVPSHRHTEGPWCHILGDVCRLVKPIPYRGAQLYFNIPDEVVRDAEWVDGRSPFTLK